MHNKPPQIGQTYVSRTTPSMVVYVVDVNIIEASEYTEAGFIVECCDPAYKQDTVNADGYDFDNDTWIKYEFILLDE
jgi:hypothetical protein